MVVHNVTVLNMIVSTILINTVCVRIRRERECDREALLAALVCRTFRERAVVFVQTKRQAHRLHVALGLLGVKVQHNILHSYS